MESEVDMLQMYYGWKDQARRVDNCLRHVLHHDCRTHRGGSDHFAGSRLLISNGGLPHLYYTCLYPGLYLGFCPFQNNVGYLLLDVDDLCRFCPMHHLDPAARHVYDPHHNPSAEG